MSISLLMQTLRCAYRRQVQPDSVLSLHNILITAPIFMSGVVNKGIIMPRAVLEPSLLLDQPTHA